MYDIKPDIDLPPALNEPKYPFDELEIGDGFHVPFNGIDGEVVEDRAVIRRRVYGAVNWANRKKAPKRFTSRTADDGMYVKRVG